jgi:two-component sensor histidine kinase
MAGPTTTTDRRMAERLVLTSRSPVLLLDGHARVVAASRSFTSTFETDGPPEMRLLAELGLGEWNVPQLQRLVEVAIGDGPEIDCYEMDLKRPHAATRHLRVNASKVASGEASEQRILLTVEDATQARRAAVANRNLLRERDDLVLERTQIAKDRDLLLSEMRHRIANSLQIIASILILKARAVRSDEGRLHLQDAHDRVLTIARIQEQLREGVVDLEVRPYLTGLAASLSASMIRDHRPVTLAVDADAAVVSPHLAVSLGLVVTELVINALKHAFPGDRAGSIVVRYRSVGSGWILSIEDDGIGMPKDGTTAQAGLGTSLVAALARQMEARVELTDCGPGTKTTLYGAPAPPVSP